IVPPLNASVCSRTSQLLTNLSLFQLSSRQVSERSLSLPFSFCARTAIPVEVTSAAINTHRPKNLYITSVSLQCLGLSKFLRSYAALKHKHRKTRCCDTNLLRPFAEPQCEGSPADRGGFRAASRRCH